MKKINMGTTAKNIWHGLVTWEWTKRLLFWIIVSAGTMSELAFLLASLWMSVNANVHPFIVHTLHISEDTSTNITYLATTAYVALPECIVALAVITTIGHVRMVVYNPRDFWPWVWSILCGLPAVFFLILSMITLSNAVANVTFTMPVGWVVVRANAAFIYAFSSLLYLWMGKKQEKDRLVEKDELTAQRSQEYELKLAEMERNLSAKIADLAGENQRLQGVIEQQNRDLDARKKQQSELQNALNKSSRAGLQAYSQECQEWLTSGIKTALPDEISRFTGHSKRKVNNAIAAGKLQVSPRNKSLVLVHSLVEWLEQNPPSSEPDLYVVNG